MPPLDRRPRNSRSKLLNPCRLVALRAKTNDVSTMLTLLTSTDAVAPATDVSVVTALRDGTLARLDVSPPLKVQLTLGIIEGAGRTRVPAVERALEIARAHFASITRDLPVPRAKMRRKSGNDRIRRTTR